MSEDYWITAAVALFKIPAKAPPEAQESFMEKINRFVNNQDQGESHTSPNLYISEDVPSSPQIENNAPRLRPENLGQVLDNVSSIRRDSRTPPDSASKSYEQALRRLQKCDEIRDICLETTSTLEIIPICQEILKRRFNAKPHGPERTVIKKMLTLVFGDLPGKRSNFEFRLRQKFDFLPFVEVESKEVGGGQ